MLQEIARLPICSKDCFFGIVSTAPIGSLRVVDVASPAQAWALTRLLVAVSPAHLLDSVSADHQWLFWLSFTLLIAAMLSVDLFCVVGRPRGQLGDALRWTVVWMTVAFVFAAGVFGLFGRGPAIVWITSYLLEKSLSVDNLFVFVTIFASFRTPLRLQHKVHRVSPFKVFL